MSNVLLCRQKRKQKTCLLNYFISCFQDSCELFKGPYSLPQSRSSFSFSLAEKKRILLIIYYLLLACLIPYDMFVCVVGGVEGLLIGLSEDQDNRRENVTISDASAALSNLLESNSGKIFCTTDHITSVALVCHLVVRIINVRLE